MGGPRSVLPGPSLPMGQGLAHTPALRRHLSNGPVRSPRTATLSWLQFTPAGSWNFMITDFKVTQKTRAQYNRKASTDHAAQSTHVPRHKSLPQFLQENHPHTEQCTRDRQMIGPIASWGKAALRTPQECLGWPRLTRHRACQAQRAHPVPSPTPQGRSMSLHSTRPVFAQTLTAHTQWTPEQQLLLLFV